jgi:hypothetical protein
MTGSPRPPLSQLHGERASTMVSTFQLTRSTELRLTHLVYKRSNFAAKVSFSLTFGDPRRAFQAAILTRHVVAAARDRTWRSPPKAAREPRGIGCPKSPTAVSADLRDSDPYLLKVVLRPPNVRDGSEPLNNCDPGPLNANQNSERRSSVWIVRQEHPNRFNAYGRFVRYCRCVSLSEQGTLRHAGAPDRWPDRIDPTALVAKLG